MGGEPAPPTDCPQAEVGLPLPQPLEDLGLRVVRSA